MGQLSENSGILGKNKEKKVLYRIKEYINEGIPQQLSLNWNNLNTKDINLDLPIIRFENYFFNIC